MNTDLRKKMDDAWAYIWSGLFYEKTGLFYDYRTSLDFDHQFDCLPKPDEIARQYPNPCGWGTGMEDSMLNAGSVLEVLCLKKELETDPSLLSLVADVLDGAIKCAYIHGVDGFLARSLCPTGGSSCYFNSSRDQFTLCVYGAWRFLKAFPDVPDEVSDAVQGLILNIAKYCEIVIVPENDNLLRLDGHQALMSSMVHVAPHELLRLPMIYSAAWYATEDDHWLKLFRKYSEAGIEAILSTERDGLWEDSALWHMQLSLALLYEVDPDSRMKKRYSKAMLMAAEIACSEMRKLVGKAAGFSGSWDVLNTDWRKMPMTVHPDTRNASGDAVLGGYEYLMPQFSEAFSIPYGILRGMGNLASTMFSCREYKPSQDLLNGFVDIAMKPDYSNHGSGGPINILHAYWLGLSRGFF